MKPFALLSMTLATLSLVAPFSNHVALGQDSSPTLVQSEMQDWPQWRGQRRNGISEETGLLDAWPEGGPARSWAVANIGFGYSSPIVANKTVFITGDEDNDLIISAFSLDGKPRWQTKNGAAWKRSYPGARSSCTYDNGKLYHMNAHGRLVCLDAETGDELWVVNVLERFEGKNIMWGISESLIVHGDLVFATPCGAKALAVALDKNSGDTVWATPALDGEKPSYASPILVKTDDRTMLINSAIKNAFAVDAKTGELCWHVPHEDTENTVSTIPVLTPAGLIISNASRRYGFLYGISLDGSDSKKTWSKKLSISHGSTVGVGDQVYGASSRGDMRGWVAIDAKTGSVQKAAEMGVGSLTYADGHFYCLTEKGMMTLQKPTENGFKTVGSFEFAEGKDVWSHPVICHGKLYLRNKDSLVCYDIRS
jgi:outer membrane protein assembly factor BamB